jgi:pilus assembly protein Flp/PilA
MSTRMALVREVTARMGEVVGMMSGGPSLRDDTGATAVEYCLLATFIAVAVIGSVTLLGTQLVGLFSAVFPAL